MAEESGLEASLGKRVGGIPVWAIGTTMAVLIIGFITWRNFKNNKDSSNTEGNTDTTEDPNAIDPATGLPYSQEGGDLTGYPSSPISSYLADNPTSSAYPVGMTPQGLPGPVTNQQWARLAADELLAKGDDPQLVESAMAKYLNGTSLTAAEQAVVNQALQTFGSPPEGVLAPAPPSTTTTKLPAPTNLHPVHVTKSSIEVGWTPVTGALGYYVDLYSSTIPRHNVATLSHNATTYTHGGLAKDRNYRFYVRGFNQYGAGTDAVVSVKTASK